MKLVNGRFTSFVEAKRAAQISDSLPREQAVDDIDDQDIETVLPDPTVHRGIYSLKFKDTVQFELNKV